MKAIVNTAPGKLEMCELPLPEPKSGEVRIKTIACGICATDFEMIDGCARSKYPQILGHEWTGIIDKVGTEGSQSIIGTICVGENVLASGGEIGFEYPGGYAEYFITVAENLHFLPEDISIEKTMLTEPLAVSVRGLRRLKLTNKNNALIFGDGPIGLIMLILLKKAGVQTIGLIGKRPKRLDLAKKLGASFCINFDDTKKAIKKQKQAHFFNFIEASGSGEALDTLFELTSLGSRILLLGDYGEQSANLNWLEVIHKELTIIGSNASAGAWSEATDLIQSKDLLFEKLITHNFPADEFCKAVNTARKPEFNAIKVLLHW